MKGKKIGREGQRWRREKKGGREEERKKERRKGGREEGEPKSLKAIFLPRGIRNPDLSVL